MPEHFEAVSSGQKSRESKDEPIRIGDRNYQIGTNVEVRVVRDKDGKLIRESKNGKPEVGWTFGGRRDDGTLRLISPDKEKVAIEEKVFIQWQNGGVEQTQTTPIDNKFSGAELRQIESDDRRLGAGIVE